MTAAVPAYTDTNQQPTTHTPSNELGLHRVLSHGEVSLLLQLSLRLLAQFRLGEAAADGARLLGAQVQRDVLFAGVHRLQGVALVLLDHRQHARDRLAHGFAICKVEGVRFGSR